MQVIDYTEKNGKIDLPKEGEIGTTSGPRSGEPPLGGPRGPLNPEGDLEIGDGNGYLYDLAEQAQQVRREVWGAAVREGWMSGLRASSVFAANSGRRNRGVSQTSTFNWYGDPRNGSNQDEEEGEE